MKKTIKLNLEIEVNYEPSTNKLSSIALNDPEDGFMIEEITIKENDLLSIADTIAIENVLIDSDTFLEGVKAENY